MKNNSFKIGNEIIYPGERLNLALPLPELFSCAPLYIPIKIIHGKQKGPCLFIMAGMHGNEINGTEIINRLLNLSMINKLRGTLITVPMLNVYGLVNRTRFLPGNIELDRCFPGSERGPNAARMAYILSTEIIDKIDYCIDLRTGGNNFSSLPRIYVDLHDSHARELAIAFNPPVISMLEVEEGSLALLAKKQGKIMLRYEGGEAQRFDESAIRAGVMGIVNVMRKLNMLSEKLTAREKMHHSFLTESSLWVRAAKSGISHTKIRLGQLVKKNQDLSEIKDPFGTSDSVIISSPNEGIVVGKNNLPLVHEGTNLFQLAVFSKVEQVASQLELWKQSHVGSPSSNE